MYHLILVSILLSVTTSQHLYANPVISSNSPDPGVLVLADGSFVVVTTSCFATNGTSPAFPINTSPDLVHWTLQGYVFPTGLWPSWAYRDMWGPEIHLVNNNYIVYYTARHRVTNKLCIGAAISTSKTILGPYKDLGKPLITNDTNPLIGVIGATHFYDVDRTPYLIWKVDANSGGEDSSILMRRINEDGMSFAESSEVTTLITSAFPWEGLVVEGAWMVYRDGFYYLFYSGGHFYNEGYSVAVARSTHVRGPYQHQQWTILHTDFNKYVEGKNTTFIGPGHCSVVQSGSGDWWMVYHAYRWNHTNIYSDPRVMLVDKISWSSTGWPTVGQGYPSVTPLPIPTLN